MNIEFCSSQKSVNILYFKTTFTMDFKDSRVDGKH